MKSSSTLNFLQCSILTSCIVEKIMLDRTQKVPRPMGLWVCQPVHDSTRRGTTKVAKCKYEGMDLCVSAKICVHHKVVLTFHDKCVKCVCPTAALVAESRAFILVKSCTTFKHAHTLMTWCKSETWKCQQELVYLVKQIHSYPFGCIQTMYFPPALLLPHNHLLHQCIAHAIKCYINQEGLWNFGLTVMQTLQ